MKLSAVKLFEIASLDPKFRNGLAPLIEFINTNFDQVIRALSGQLNLDDNLASRRIEISFTHGVSKDIVVENANLVAGILPLRVKHPTTACLGVGWRVVDARTIQVTPYFSNTGASNISTSLVVLYL